VRQLILCRHVIRCHLPVFCMFANTAAAQRRERGRAGGATEREWRNSSDTLRSVEYFYVFFLKNSFPTYSYDGSTKTGLLRGFQKSSGGTGIVIPVKKVPQERKTQES